MSAVGPGWFFNYLTNWGTVIYSITYLLLTVEHLRAGHFSKNFVMRANTRLQLWKLTVFAYESLVTFILVVTLGFWTLVFPHMMMIEKTRQDYRDSYEERLVSSNSTSLVLPPIPDKTGIDLFVSVLVWTGIASSHIVPGAVLILDVYLSSINFYPNHFCFILLGAILYTTYFLYRTFVQIGPTG